MKKHYTSKRDWPRDLRHLNPWTHNDGSRNMQKREAVKKKVDK